MGITGEDAKKLVEDVEEIISAIAEKYEIQVTRYTGSPWWQLRKNLGGSIPHVEVALLMFDPRHPRSGPTLQTVSVVAGIDPVEKKLIFSTKIPEEHKSWVAISDGPEAIESTLDLAWRLACQLPVPDPVSDTATQVPFHPWYLYPWYL